MKIREMLRTLFGSAGLSDDAKQKVEAEINKIPDIEIKEESGEPEKKTDKKAKKKKKKDGGNPCGPSNPCGPRK